MAKPNPLSVQLTDEQLKQMKKRGLIAGYDPLFKRYELTNKGEKEVGKLFNTYLFEDEKVGGTD